MIVCLYLSTPIVESIKLNIPTLILLPKDTVAYDKKFLSCYAKLKNKILFDNQIRCLTILIKYGKILTTGG